MKKAMLILAAALLTLALLACAVPEPQQDIEKEHGGFKPAASETILKTPTPKPPKPAPPADTQEPEASALPEEPEEPEATPTPEAVKEPSKVPESTEKPEDKPSKVPDKKPAKAADISGLWADSVSGRAYMSIEKDGDTYKTEISWADSSSTTGYWSFTAKPSGNGDEYLYSDCRAYTVKLGKNGSISDKTAYLNGKGSLTLKDGKLYWRDENETAGASCVFEKTKAKSIEGNWLDATSGRAEMSVSRSGSSYNVNISWTDGAFCCYFWQLTAKPGSVPNTYNYSNCEKICEEYARNNGTPRTSVVFSDGTGSFTLRDGKLYWTDNEENVGAGCVFEKVKNTDIAGLWRENKSGRAVIDVKKKGDNYKVAISWADSAKRTFFWTFTAKPGSKPNDYVYSDCRYYSESHPSDSKVVTETLYEGGSGRLSLKGNKLYWQDDQESAGENLVFAKN